MAYYNSEQVYELGLEPVWLQRAFCQQNYHPLDDFVWAAKLCWPTCKNNFLGQ